ncbi:glycosyltransferase involved in cell wall biosynthesis [Kitasatospora sp. MAA4]|uniref:GT4 family glycosyltransferase PelF n=1 Tax=Kitasatospora sp. MAA4 TaxID=3035093 RepID=UPI0024746E1B|nr:GT4 family glycosyltransferase PelF [Kitasatospora sp. MAA4]MDH6132819.1 glycosyltransferase involved in cell wall biosynthesis [Kitasatospora sp. MAA4]
MRVTLLTEGTYPHSHGGVSVWCDQLVQGMPDVEFDIIAVTGSGNEGLAWELPANVRSVTPAPLWGPADDRKPPRGRSLKRFLDAYERFLHAILDPVYTTHFGTELYGFADYARQGLLSAALRSEPALKTLQHVWTRAYLPTAAAQPTLHDALHATDLLEHALRPLSVEPPHDGVAHAVSGGLAALPGLIAAQQFAVPFLLTEHGIYLRERYLGYRTGPYRWPVKALLLGFYRMLAEESYSRAALVTPGNRYNRRWEERGGTPSDNIRTVYNGVDPDLFPAAGAEPATPTLSWAGRVDPIKDLETLIRAFALVRQEMPDARLRMFGGTARGAEGYRDGCIALAAELGLGDSVVFEGRVEDIQDAYAAGNVVMLSSISEGFPFTLIEAMSSGRATVSTDVGGVREAVGDTGLVVPPREPAPMAQAALELLRDPERRALMGAQARLRVIEQFTLRQNIDGFRGIYTELLGERRWLPNTVVAVDQAAEPVPVLAGATAAEPEVGYGWWERAEASG